MTDLLSLDGVTAHYGLFQALHGITLSARAGETIALVGANGAGKTTLMRTICGDLPAGGRIFLHGKDITGIPAHRLNAMGIAMVPEGRKLFPSLTVDENTQIGGYTKRPGAWSREAVYDLFPELIKRRANKALDLSGGEQQMVAIGRALMSNPDLLLMDEISLGLAPIVVNQIYEAVDKIRAAGTTIVLVEQDIGRGLSVATHVYCLLEGRVSLEGKPADLSQKALTDAYFGV
ncbi:ABC transporter ATP-binding protein [Phaeobacter sp. HF9A]|uniref:ABC transporter ATP-binding protein n=1 Tax=Phaeobacter sp. HF9A TaxID=2721561 RepID=UPI00142FE1CF|nr:ABC transporter ATP-binding protein [Phaeobacter sp. HF9A]NIZ13570.1 ABC transporter ATP-binding protein [Phaeobacter sp. HF9A]